MSNYNLTPLDNATTLSGLMSGIDTISGGLYMTSFLILFFLFIVVAVPATIPKKFVIGSFATTFISTILFVTGVISVNATIIFGSILFLSIIWAMNE